MSEDCGQGGKSDGGLLLHLLTTRQIKRVKDLECQSRRFGFLDMLHVSLASRQLITCICAVQPGPYLGGRPVEG